MQHHVLICHAPPDLAAAEAACAELERNGHRCWLAARDAPAGADGAALAMVRASRAVVLILSGAGAGTPLLTEAAEHAAANGVPIIALVMDGQAPQPAAPVAHRIAAMTRPLDSHLVYLATAVERLLDDEPTRGRALTEPPRPLPRAGTGAGWLAIAIAGLLGIAAIAMVALLMD